MDEAYMIRSVSTVLQPCVVLFELCHKTVARLRVVPNATVAASTVSAIGRSASILTDSDSGRTMSSAMMKTVSGATTTQHLCRSSTW